MLFSRKLLIITVRRNHCFKPPHFIGRFERFIEGVVLIRSRRDQEVSSKATMSTSDLIGYSHDFLAEFIQLYRSFPCLWQIKYKGYKDRLLRNRAYDALVQKLREVNPIADRETVIRKINTLRTAFRREYKKVRSSQRMVQNPRQRYKSSLWYYDILKFVAEQNETNTLDEERDVKNALVNPTDLSQEEIMVRLGTIFFKTARIETLLFFSFSYKSFFYLSIYFHSFPHYVNYWTNSFDFIWFSRYEISHKFVDTQKKILAFHHFVTRLSRLYDKSRAEKERERNFCE